MSSNNCRDIIFFNVRDNIKEKDFYVVNADFTGRPFISIKEQYRGHLVQVGIAEQNMMAISCGLALAGKKVVTYSPNPFEYLRAYDQIRNGICMMNLPITIVANGIGLVNPGLGATHFATEDYQLFSLLPNMQIFTVSDENIALKVSDYIIAGVEHPTYVRIDFGCDGRLGSVTDEDFQRGFRMLKKGKKIVIITQGYTSKTAFETCCEKECAILELFRRPYDDDALYDVLNQFDKIIVIEEHQTRGGLSSELLEKNNDLDWNLKIDRLGIDYGDCFPHNFGDRAYWMKRFHVDGDALSKKIEE